MKLRLIILDCDYIQVNGKTVVRIFGKTEDGEPVCVFTNGYRPYFYLDTDDIENTRYEIEKMGLDVEIVERIPPKGFSKPKKVLKIYGRDPSKIPEIRKECEKFGTVYEADILFKYRYMVDHGLKGMCWIEAEGKFINTQTVKCKAFEAEKIFPVDKHDYPDFKYLSLDIECIPEEERIPDPEKDSIAIISLAFYPEYKGRKTLVLVKKPINGGEILGFSSEEEMLMKFLDIIRDFDPDIILGYNINNFDLPYIVKRLEVLGLPRDLGRSEKSVFIKNLQNGSIPTISGRVVVDPYEIIRRDPRIRFRRYDLDTVCTEMLGVGKKEMDGFKEMRELWFSGNEGVRRFIEYSRTDAELVLRLVIEKNLLDKFFELSRISGVLLQDCFGGQTQRHECRLLHEFYKRKILMPCKPSEKEVKKYLEERIVKGALVLEPDIGLHKDGCVLVLDFASLYPSIIRTFNLCPTTLVRNNEEVDSITTPVGAKFVKPEIREGVFPCILKELIETRKKVKKEMKSETDPERKRLLNAKQLALKDMANSLYGYTAYPRARLFMLEVANSITAFGRENIEKTKRLIEKEFGVKVLYGDTDSVFVKTDIKDLEKAFELGERISEFITEKLPGVLSLEFEKIFKTFLIVSKKRYAGWKFEKGPEGWIDGIETKGMEVVRRDWCPLTTEVMKNVIEIILKEGDISKAATYIKGIINDLRNGKIPIEKLTIVKGLTKHPDEYDGVQPHVELARKMRMRDPSRAPVVGDRIGYVIIKGNELISKRAEDPAYVVENNLEIDTEYYVENQLLPPLERIFEVCGIKKNEILEGVRQKNLFSFGRVLDGYDSVSCPSCNWSFRRPPLRGVCPECNSELNFSKYGYLGRFIHMKVT
ncbi:MAG: DNA polymerase elongation subunit [Candidatus Micrarchaeota archaeon]|nr:DNA polymerase elongation subunit [Candidatus Micrarchaeota archaeon]